MNETAKTLTKTNIREIDDNKYKWAGILANIAMYINYLIITCGIQFQDVNAGQVLGWDIYEIIVVILFLILNSCNIFFRKAKFVS